jgi:flagellar protein FlaG
VLTPVAGTIGSIGAEAGSGAAARPTAAARSAPSAERPPQADSARAPAQPIDSAQLQDAVLRAGDAVRKLASNLLFSLDQETGKTVIKIVDSQTNEVIRQIPSEEVLAIARNLDRIEGLLLKQKA